MSVWHDSLFASIFAVLPVIAWTTPVLRRFAIVLLIVSACMAIAGWAFAERWPSMLIMQLQPLRALKIYMILAYVAGAAWLCRRRSSAAWLVAAGCLMTWLAKFDDLFVILVVVAIIVRLFPFMRGHDPNRLWGVVTFGITAVVVAGVLVRSILDSPGSSDGAAMRRYRPPLDVPWRVTNSPWVDVQRWIAAHTPTDAYFISPPILEGFRTYAKRSEYADWKQVSVNIDYHISFDDHYYSVPYTLVGEKLWCRATHHTVELSHRGKRIASHVRSFVKYAYSTLPEHRPASHRAYLEWTPSRLINWGKTVGPHTAAVVEHVIRSKPHPEQGYRSALGLLRLSDRYSAERLERACERAITLRSASYRTVKTMLKQRMETAPLFDQIQSPDPTAELGAVNVRGRRYYN